MAEETELERVRARVHNINDRVQVQTVDIAVLKREAELIRRDHNELEARAVSMEHVDLAVKLIEEKIESVKKIIEPIQSNLVWGTRIVVLAVLAALLRLVVKGGI